MALLIIIYYPSLTLQSKISTPPATPPEARSSVAINNTWNFLRYPAACLHVYKQKIGYRK